MTEKKQREIEEVVTPESNDDPAASMWGTEDYNFQGQRPDEKVMLVRNQHPVVLAKPILLFLVSLIIPYVLIRFTGGGFRLYALGIYSAPAFYWISATIYSYLNGVCLLTNQRLINVDQRGFFTTQVSEAELNRIQDVSSETKGILPTIFRFGDVSIRTASNASLLILKNMGDPYEVQQMIVRTLKEAK